MVRLAGSGNIHTTGILRDVVGGIHGGGKITGRGNIHTTVVLDNITKPCCTRGITQASQTQTTIVLGDNKRRRLNDSITLITVTRNINRAVVLSNISQRH